MEKEKTWVIKGIELWLPDGSKRMVECRAFSMGPMGVSCFRTGSISMDLEGNYLHTFIFAHIVGYDVIWEQE